MRERSLPVKSYTATWESLCSAHGNLTRSTLPQWKANSLLKLPIARDARHIWTAWELKLLRYRHHKGLLPCHNTQRECLEKTKNEAHGKYPFEQLSNCESASVASKLAPMWRETAGPQPHGCCWCTWGSSCVTVCSFLFSLFSFVFVWWDTILIVEAPVTIVRKLAGLTLTIESLEMFN